MGGVYAPQGAPWWSHRWVWRTGAAVVGLALGLNLFLVPGVSLDTIAAIAYLGASSLWAAFGLLLWAKRPEHPMGPLLTAAGIASIGVVPAFLMGGMLEQFEPVLEPHPWWMIVSVAMVGVYTYLTVLSLDLFPDGRPTTRWRRWLVRFLLLLMVITTVAGFLAEPLGPTAHPFAPDAITGPARQIYVAFSEFYFLLLILVVGLKIFEYRRATAERKAQLKWLVFMLILYAIAGVWTVVVVGLENITIWNLMGDPLLLGLIAGTMTLAVLRYRLYEIDRIVSRTVSYALVVAIIAAVFALPVVILPGLIGASNNVIVAGATLVAAALFNPVRRRIQIRVDRRFNRAKYDADREFASFIDSLQTSVSTTEIRVETLDLVTRVLQPKEVGMWVKGPER